MSDLNDAVYKLFVAFGAQRNTEQARLVVEELRAGSFCQECATDAVLALMRTSRRLPSLMAIRTEAIEIMNSDAHSPHIVNPLAPRAEGFWRHEATKVILPMVGGDRDLAALIAAQLWWFDLEPDLDRVVEELQDHPVWITGARDFAAANPPTSAIADAAFRRAQWFHEHHPSETPPPGLVELQGGQALLVREGDA